MADDKVKKDPWKNLPPRAHHTRDWYPDRQGKTEIFRANTRPSRSQEEGQARGRGVERG